MISALQALKRFTEIQDPQTAQPAIQAMKISNPAGIMRLFASHPPLDSKSEDRADRGEPQPGSVLELGLRQPAPIAQLAFVILVRFVDGDAAEIFGDFEQALVALVPIGADFAQKHRSLVGPA